MSSGLCNDQATFNNALSTGLDAYEKSNEPKTGSMVAFLIVWFLFLVIAVMMAFHVNVPDQSHRIIHLFFAIIAPPAYILANLSSMISK